MNTFNNIAAATCATVGAIVLFMFMLAGFGAGNFAVIYHYEQEPGKQIRYVLFGSAAEVNKQEQMLKPTPKE
jgi:hypothetical protein